MIFRGTFSDCRRVQSGGEATVYRALQNRDRLVALKVYKEARPLDSSLVSFLKAHRHPNVAALYAAEVHENHFVTVSEYIRGVPTSSLVPMSPLVATPLLRGVVAGLVHLQGSGVPHGDISPENILVKASGEPVLIDCGMDGLGTPRFAAPERFGGMPPSVKSDLFSIGLLLYFWLSGEPLCTDESFEAIADMVSRIDSCDISQQLHGRGRFSPETLGCLAPLWTGLLRYAPEERLEDFEELDERLEILEEQLRLEQHEIGNREMDPWVETVRLRTEERERALDALPAEYPFDSENQWFLDKKYLRLSLASLLVLIIVILISFLWMDVFRNAPVDQMGVRMLKKSRDIPSEEVNENAEGSKGDAGSFRDVLIGAPTPALDKEEK